MNINKSRFIVCILFLITSQTLEEAVGFILALPLPSNFDPNIDSAFQNTQPIASTNQNGWIPWFLNQPSTKNFYSANKLIEKAIVNRLQNKVSDQHVLKNPIDDEDKHFLNNGLDSNAESIYPLFQIPEIFENTYAKSDTSAGQIPYNIKELIQNEKHQNPDTSVSEENMRLDSKLFDSLEGLKTYVEKQLQRIGPDSKNSKGQSPDWDWQNKKSLPDLKHFMSPGASEENSGSYFSKTKSGGSETPNQLWTGRLKKTLLKKSKDWTNAYVLGGAMGRRR